MAWWALWILLAYLAGSIPFGYLIARGRGIDIRDHGSGNIGATNVGRVLGRQWGRFCLVLDILKGLTPTLAAGLAMGMVGGRSGRADGGPTDAALATDPSFWGAAADWLWLAVAAAAILGHIFPVWLRLRGGKGVATGLGATLGVFPVLTVAAAIAAVVWVVSAKATRYVGVSSCLAAVTLPVIVGVELWLAPAWGGSGAHLAVALALAALVLWRHRSNLARTLRGTEPRIGEPHPAQGVEEGRPREPAAPS